MTATLSPHPHTPPTGDPTAGRHSSGLGLEAIGRLQDRPAPTGDLLTAAQRLLREKDQRAAASPDREGRTAATRNGERWYRAPAPSACPSLHP